MKLKREESASPQVLLNKRQEHKYCFDIVLVLHAITKTRFSIAKNCAPTRASSPFPLPTWRGHTWGKRQPNDGCNHCMPPNGHAQAQLQVKSQASAVW
jgi:hypothetical protein